MGFLLAAAAVAAVAAGARAECVPLAEAASQAGLTAIVDAVGAVADVEGADALLATATMDTPAPEGARVTVFAPTNEAFAEIADVVATLSPDAVADVLFNHIVAKELLSTDIVAALEESSPAPVELTSLLGATLEVTTDRESIFVTPAGSEVAAKVVTADVETCAGVVHVVDKVLVPAEDVAPEPEVVDEVPEEPEVRDREAEAGAYGEEDVAGAYGEDVAGAYGA